jgi:hypothetical protein
MREFRPEKGWEFWMDLADRFTCNLIVPSMK